MRYKEDYRCYFFLCFSLIIFLTLTISFRYLFWLFALIGDYWYLSLPSFITFISAIYLIVQKKKNQYLLETFNNELNQKNYKLESSNEALIEGKPSSMYMKWLKEKFITRKNATKLSLWNSLKGIFLCLMLVIIASALYILWSNIILQNLPLFRAG